MTKKEFIDSKSNFGYVEFEEYLSTFGINNISKKDLDYILKKQGYDKIVISHFIDIYTIKCSERSSVVMTYLTVVIGLLTVAVSLVSIFN